MIAHAAIAAQASPVGARGGLLGALRLVRMCAVPQMNGIAVHW
jgi:hypothetical protein